MMIILEYKQSMSGASQLYRYDPGRLKYGTGHNDLYGHVESMPARTLLLQYRIYICCALNLIFYFSKSIVNRTSLILHYFKDHFIHASDKVVLISVLTILV